MARVKIEAEQTLRRMGLPVTVYDRIVFLQSVVDIKTLDQLYTEKLRLQDVLIGNIFNLFKFHHVEVTVCLLFLLP